MVMKKHKRIKQLKRDMDDLIHRLDAIEARLAAVEMGAPYAPIDVRAEMEADWEDGMDFPPYPAQRDYKIVGSSWMDG